MIHGWGAWNAIPPQKPVVLKPFLAKLTRRISFNRCGVSRPRSGAAVKSTRCWTS